MRKMNIKDGREPRESKPPARWKLLAPQKSYSKTHGGVSLLVAKKAATFCSRRGKGPCKGQPSQALQLVTCSFTRRSHPCSPGWPPIHTVLASERQPREIVPPRVPLHPFSLQSQLRSLFSNLERELGASNGPVHSLNPVVMLSANTGTLFANPARPARAAVRDALPALSFWKRR